MYHVLFPDPALAPFIENYWSVYPGPGETVDLSVNVYVDARADLLFNFGAPYTREIIGGEMREYASSNLDAHRVTPIRIVQRGAVAIVGVRFHTGGLAPFIGVSAESITDQTVLPALAFGPGIFAIEHELRATVSDFTLQKSVLDAFFLSVLKSAPPLETFLRLKTKIEAAEGAINMDRLCAESGLSQRSLDRLFARFLGFSPKYFARVVRFQKALKMLMKDPQCSLADVAALCGYYDQPHFIKDFRLFSGGVPRGYKGYYPPDSPRDFAPNVVHFLQDEAYSSR